jgi:hypothetical protein
LAVLLAGTYLVEVVDFLVDAVVWVEVFFASVTPALAEPVVVIVPEDNLVAATVNVTDAVLLETTVSGNTLVAPV